MMWSNGMGWVDWLLMILTMVALWALVTFGILALFRGTSDPGVVQPGHDPDRVLDEEFARGRIDAEEYRARHNVLHARH